ncbi:AAA family ATPase [Xylanimonas ulmi]|uniref:AAA family ATPase n=1 Tax=Xylanimonas ulmi TaxID=228973 RepID=UPI001A920AE3|nr:AAA family ATPase [Xylanibacterium ulmi]
MTAPDRPAGRAVVLLTGMSGAGKTAALRGLAARGHAVADLDYDGHSVLVRAPGQPVGWEQVWDLVRVRARIDAHGAGVLFLAGTAPNQSEVYDRLDAVVLLTAPREVLLARVAARTDNPYGKDAAGRAQIEHDIDAVEPLLRRGATHVVSSDRPLADVVTDVERIAAGVVSAADG